MDFRRCLFLVPFLKRNKPTPKQELFVEYALLTNLSLSSFNHVLFELRAFKVLSLDKTGVFSIDGKKFKSYLSHYPNVEYDFKTLKSIKPVWCKKWEKTVQDLLN